jgi:hypothetical protein
MTFAGKHSKPGLWMNGADSTKVFSGLRTRERVATRRVAAFGARDLSVFGLGLFALALAAAGRPRLLRPRRLAHRRPACDRLASHCEQVQLVPSLLDESGLAPLRARLDELAHQTLVAWDANPGQDVEEAGVMHVSFTIFEGTSEIQRIIIGRALTGLDVR